MDPLIALPFSPRRTRRHLDAKAQLTRLWTTRGVSLRSTERVGLEHMAHLNPIAFKDHENMVGLVLHSVFTSLVKPYGSLGLKEVKPNLANGWNGIRLGNVR